MFTDVANDNICLSGFQISINVGSSSSYEKVIPDIYQDTTSMCFRGTIFIIIVC